MIREEEGVDRKRIHRRMKNKQGYGEQNEGKQRMWKKEQRGN